MSNRTGIKLTPDLLKSHIAEVIYEDREVGGHRVITAHFKMDNGFIVWGKNSSTSIDPANFDEELGKKLAYEKTFSQLWELEAYRAIIEREQLEKAVEDFSIDLDQYVSERGLIAETYGVGFTKGHSQNILFRHPRDPMRGFVANFLKTDNPAYDDRCNTTERKKVEDYIRSHMKVEELNSDLVVRIAKICHEANRAYCKSIGDDSQPSWVDAPDWQRQSACNGVKFHLLGEHAPSESHDNWLKDKEADGWVYGLVKDPAKKEHPCMVPYDQLPVEQRTKDYIFKSIVETFK